MVAITHATPGFLSLERPAQNAALHALARLCIEKRGDWLYSVPAEEIPGGLPDNSLYIFFAQNETGGFTAMLGSEY
jgi:hypothetical protein